MIGEHIDERFRVTFGHVEFQSPKDDPMNIFSTSERDPRPAAGEPTEEQQVQQRDHTDQAHLDAFGKGGKGQVKKRPRVYKTTDCSRDFMKVHKLVDSWCRPDIRLPGDFLHPCGKKVKLHEATRLDLTYIRLLIIKLLKLNLKN